MTVVCPHCGKSVERPAAWVNRAQRDGFAVYCSRRCSGLGRRVYRSRQEKVVQKAEYDRMRRLALADEVRAKKREHHRRTYDPAVAREQRKRRSFDHAAYCRRYYADPAKKAEKVNYDRDRRASVYADYAESWKLLVELEREICRRMPDKYERQKARGYFDRIKESHNERRRQIA